MLVSALVAAHGVTAVAQAALSWYSCAQITTMALIAMVVFLPREVIHDRQCDS